MQDRVQLIKAWRNQCWCDVMADISVSFQCWPMSLVDDIVEFECSVVARLQTNWWRECPSRPLLRWSLPSRHARMLFRRGLKQRCWLVSRQCSSFSSLSEQTWSVRRIGLLLVLPDVVMAAEGNAIMFYCWLFSFVSIDERPAMGS